LGFTSVCINVGVYLPWLASWALEAGVALRRGVVAHLGDAGTMHRSGAPAAVVVNATGLGSRDLAGVRDGKVFPARGQTVLVRDSPRVMIATSGTDDAGDEACYIMERAAGI
jgi:D-amino-acid oxidase